METYKDSEVIPVHGPNKTAIHMMAVAIAQFHTQLDLKSVKMLDGQLCIVVNLCDNSCHLNIWFGGPLGCSVENGHGGSSFKTYGDLKDSIKYALEQLEQKNKKKENLICCSQSLITGLTCHICYMLHEINVDFFYVCMHV
jgi:hypothetical protein